MRYMKFLWLILLGAFSAPMFAQEKLEKELDRYKTTLKQVILQDAAKEGRVKEFLTNTIQVIIIPQCQFTGTAQQVIVDSSAIDNMQIDTNYYRALLRKDNQVVVVIEKQGLRTPSFMTIGEYGGSENVPQWVNMVEKAGFEKRLFSIDLLMEESRMKQIAFVNQRQLQFVDAGLQVYSGIQPLLVNKYGSVDKFVELKKENLEKMQLLQNNASPESWKHLVRNNYTKWTERYPTDTAGVFDLFVKEMDTIVRLSNRQKELLKQTITNKLLNCSKYNGRPGIQFIDRDIAPLVYTVLTQEQYARYIYQRGLNAWVANEAFKKLEIYYVREKSVPLDSLSKVYDREVFSLK
ncbi:MULTISPECIES: hypothetical protein [Niastella]|uniref:Uncharacterized protein n=1 Tax=Niastella soli TaxID=2821487 RepID=A0ABS3Z5I0_9BACT|nr:hypothetical protein [Niastella soli]MBO9205398.1 hypothetical protein [Niastella soli]